MASEKIETAIAETFAWTLGMVVCTVMLGGMFTIGRMAAKFLGWPFSPDMFGLLCAISFLWLYEHRGALHRYDRICARLDDQPN